jgi:hypothetical protein
MSEDTGVTQDLPEGEAVDETATDNAPATVTEQATEEPESTPDEPKRKPWFQERIDQLTREKYDERRAREAVEKTLADYNAGRTDDTVPKDVDRLVAQRAQEIVRETAFNDKCNEVYSSGKSEFSDFDDTLGNFRMLGGLTPDLIEAVTQLPDAHKVLYALGQNMDEAARVLSLPPVPMAMALARLSMSGPKSKPVSNAPPPIRPIDGTPRGQVDPQDMSIEEWMKWREDQLKG